MVLNEHYDKYSLGEVILQRNFESCARVESVYFQYTSVCASSFLPPSFLLAAGIHASESGSVQPPVPYLIPIATTCFWTFLGSSTNTPRCLFPIAALTRGFLPLLFSGNTQSNTSYTYYESWLIKIHSIVSRYPAFPAREADYRSFSCGWKGKE